MVASNRFEAPGLPADWLNAWLAAIGVTVLLPEVKLSWTDGAVPYAVFWVPDGMDLPDAVRSAMLTPEELEGLAIASEGPGGRLGQVVKDIGLYSARAREARAKHDTTLECSLTDLAGEQGGPVCRGQFCVGMEGAETLWKRLKKCVESIAASADPAAAIIGSLTGGRSGTPLRVAGNGLGFDPRRLPNGIESLDSNEPSPWPAVDPVVEALAFHGIQILPVRGKGDDRENAVQKPWRCEDARMTLRYPCWTHPLDRWSIDALLDVGPELGESAIQARFQVVRYKPRGNEKKVAYFSERVS